MDRIDAGRRLAEELERRGDWRDAIVLGIPRGGVVVAAQVASRLGAPLDVVLAAKVGAPGNPEYAVGAVTADGEVLVNESSGFSAFEVRALAAPALTKVKRSLELFRAGRPATDVEHHQVIVVDDGIATGLTAKAAIAYLRRCGAAEVVLAAPVASRSALKDLEPLADSTVVIDAPAWFSAVGQFYQNFGQTSDQEVQELLVSPGDNPLGTDVSAE